MKDWRLLEFRVAAPLQVEARGSSLAAASYTFFRFAVALSLLWVRPDLHTRAVASCESLPPLLLRLGRVPREVSEAVSSFRAGGLRGGNSDRARERRRETREQTAVAALAAQVRRVRVAANG